MFDSRTGLAVVSQCRGELYCLALLWIALFHSTFDLPAGFLAMVKELGYGGVDVFLFLSGVGLYYSMEREPGIGRFYKKRVLRLLPAAFIIMPQEALRWALGISSGREFLENVTLVSYWTRGYRAYWFLAAILVFYLLYPAVYRLVKSERYGLYILVLCLSLIPGLASVFPVERRALYTVGGFLFRIPVFLTGCLAAPFIKKNVPFREVPAAVLCSIVPLILGAIWGRFEERWYLRLLLFIPMCMALILLFAMAVSHLAESGKIRCAMRLAGGCTLEFYLIHERLLTALERYVFPGLKDSVLSNVLAFVVALGLAICFRKASKRIINMQ